MSTLIPKSRRAAALALCSLALFAAACRSDGTFEQRVKMQVLVDGVLSGRPVYGDTGKWRAIPYSELIRFESAYNPAPSVFHGLAHNGKVWLAQEITGGEAGAQDNDFIYVKQ